MAWRRRSVSARLRRLADELPLPVPFDVEELCRRVAEQRRRPIHLLAIPGMTDPSGVWLATTAADYLVYDSMTSQLHRDHIILHELAHLLCDHLGGERAALDDVGELVDGVGQLVSGVDPDAVLDVARRTAYGTAEEREAELLAGMIRQMADRNRWRQRCPDTAADRRVGPALDLRVDPFGPS